MILVAKLTNGWSAISRFSRIFFIVFGEIIATITKIPINTPIIRQNIPNKNFVYLSTGEPPSYYLVFKLPTF